MTQFRFEYRPRMVEPLIFSESKEAESMKCTLYPVLIYHLIMKSLRRKDEN